MKEEGNPPRDFQVRHWTLMGFILSLGRCPGGEFLLDRLNRLDHGTLGGTIAFGSERDLAAQQRLPAW